MNQEERENKAAEACCWGVSRPPGRGPVQGPGINYTGPSSYKKNEFTGPWSHKGCEPLNAHSLPGAAA
jgi:hypothetical protein